jgi:hypothetical protein
MPGRPLQTEAFVLVKRPATDAFQGFTVFSAEQGTLLVMQRVAKKSAGTSIALDLFDEAALQLESTNEGRTWFVKEARLLQRAEGIGRGYESLRYASAFAAVVARNPVHEEGRAQVATLLRTAFAAFATAARADIVFIKSLYCFARDEGYPVKEQWFPTLSTADREAVATLLNRPLADQTAPAELVLRLQHRLEDYLRGHTEILLD